MSQPSDFILATCALKSDAPRLKLVIEAGVHLHRRELLVEAVKHVFAVLVVLVHDAGLLEVLQLHHVL